MTPKRHGPDGRMLPLNQAATAWHLHEHRTMMQRFRSQPTGAVPTRPTPTWMKAVAATLALFFVIVVIAFVAFVIFFASQVRGTA